jgi:uncharacterized protein (DUF4415 family)
MRKDESIKTYTAEELKAMRRRGEDRTDWAKVDAMTEADLERAIAEPEVVDFFKAGGAGHIIRMQAVLRAYVDAQRHRREALRDRRK